MLIKKGVKIRMRAKNGSMVEVRKDSETLKKKDRSSQQRRDDKR